MLVGRAWHSSTVGGESALVVTLLGVLMEVGALIDATWESLRISRREGLTWWGVYVDWTLRASTGVGGK